MINQVIINNNYGESLTIKLPQTEPTHGLFITEIEGLGPVKANINMREVATRSGATYISSRAESRDIVFHVLYLGNNDGVSAEDARLTTYKFFPLGEKITLTFYTENRTARTTGYVESNEPDIFSDEIAGASITVSCPSAWFTLVGSDKKDTFIISDLVSEFEFEFEDPVEALPDGSIIFSSIDTGAEHIIEYDGEVETGMIIKIICDTKDLHERVSMPTIYNLETGEYIKIDTDIIEKLVNPGWKPGDLYQTCMDGNEIWISTYIRNKYVRYYHEYGTSYGGRYNALSALTLDSSWLKIHPGKNKFSYTCEEGELNLDIIITTDVLVTGV